MARVTSSWVSAALSLLVALAPAHARSPEPDAGADGGRSPPQAATSAEPQCQASTAMGRIACELAHGAGVGGVTGGVTVVSKPLRDAPAGSDVRGLAAVLSKLTAARVNGRDAGVAKGLPDAILRSKTSHLIWLQPKLNGAKLAVTLDVFTTEYSFWERVKQRTPGPSRHTFASARIDAEVRSYLPPIKLMGTRVSEAKSPVPRALALACGDIDGDGSLDLAIAGRHRVLVGKLRDGTFASALSVRWSDISEVAPAPLRQPLATLAIREARSLHFGSSDRAALGVADEQLDPTRTANGLLPWPGLGCVRRQGMGLGARLFDCNTGAESSFSPPVKAPLDTLAGSVLARRDGSTTWVGAAKTVDHDDLQLFDEHGNAAVIPDAGAQAALGDLDLDGSAEVAVSRSTLQPKDDSLRVFTWKHPTLLPRFELSVPTGIDAVAMCPPEGASQAPTVIATADRLWVLQ